MGAAARLRLSRRPLDRHLSTAMIRRTAWFRTLATLLAVWLPLVAGEPGVLQPCPMHGAARAVIATLRGQPVEPGMVGGTGPAATSSHQHHDMGSATSASADHSSPASNHAHHTCSCIDGCSAASLVAFVVPQQPATEFVVAAYETTRSVPTVASLARPSPEFSRPYTTGPPRA
jgi:hypothetical protein